MFSPLLVHFSRHTVSGDSITTSVFSFLIVWSLRATNTFQVKAEYCGSHLLFRRRSAYLLLEQEVIIVACAVFIM